MSSTEKENKELLKLANIQEDQAEFYEEAQEKAKSDRMEEIFKNLEVLHNTVKGNILQIIRTNGGDADAEADETMIGEIRQFFADMHAKISNDSDETWVSHLEEGEDRSLDAIKDAMEDDDISAATKAALQKELNTLQQSHDYMKALKECMQEAA